VAHAYNPSYSGGRDQEDHSSKPGGKTLTQKNPSQKSAGGVAQGVGPVLKKKYIYILHICCYCWY
jgi:hypothetical protein